MRPVAELDLPLRLDRASSQPLQWQLTAQLRTAVVAGTLPAGRRLPASRTLSTRLGIARSTVLAAFEQLLGEGVLESRHGSGTYVAAAVRVLPAAGAAATATPAPAVRPVLDLRPGRVDTARLPDEAWRRAWRRASGAVPSDEPEPEGIPQLRAAIAAHCAASRGVAARPDAVVVSGGTREALVLLVRALGLRRVAVEDPGYAAARRALEAAGAEPVPAPVDDLGLRVEDLPADVDAVLVTPNHQYPLGGTMPLARRTALLAWARATGAVVIEDDYDGEFRFDVLPLPALAALSPDHVVHLGTFAKSISPWIRCGYLLVPPALGAAVRRTRADLAQPVDGITQAALAHYLAEGGLARHTARSRRDHAHRRARLLELLRAHPTLVARGSSAGLHLVVELPPTASAVRVLAQLADRGIVLADLDAYRVHSAGGPALVLGYGAASVTELEVAVTELAAAIGQQP